jgi:hypothetical protein
MTPRLVYEGRMQIGSLGIRLAVEHPTDLAALDAMFKQCVGAPSPDGDAGPEGELFLVRAEDDRHDVPPDGMRLREEDGTLTLRTELVSAALAVARRPWPAWIAVAEGANEERLVRVHLSVAVHRILLALGAAYLHAAGVIVDGRTFVLVGEKGSGKSTTSLVLGRAGATILADDHVLVRRTPDRRYFASGCERLTRVTGDTEAFVFDRPLEAVPADFGGTLKKEVPLAPLVRTLPGVDVPITTICFSHVGSRLALSRRSPAQTALDLLGRTRRSFRPQDAGDIATLLDFWTGLSASARCWDLELSPNLADLARLPDLLTRA